MGLVISLSVAVSALLAATAEPSQEEADLPLTSVVRRHAAVFASNEAGLFRADLTTKQWRRLTLPEGMPNGGGFARLPEDSPLMLYAVANPSSIEAKKPNAGQIEKNKARKFSFYLSKTDGQTWDLISEKEDFEEVLLLPNGSLFAAKTIATATSPGTVEWTGRVFMSKDLGKSWRDISGVGFTAHPHLSPDPDHPGLVCIRNDPWVKRPTVTYAEDEQFNWISVKDHDWRPKAEFFLRSSMMKEYLQATLNNYFLYDFGSTPFAPAFDISVAQSRFEVEAGQAVSVPITIVFREDFARRLRDWKQSTTKGQAAPRPTPVSFQFPDQKVGLDCWKLRLEHNGRRATMPQDNEDPFGSATDDKGAKRMDIKEKPAKDDDWKSIEVSASRPYQRTLALSKLYDFSDPGEYRVQLEYDNLDLDLGHPIVWRGCFTSPVFTVVVKGRK
jgi:hypothetical protein